VRKLRRIFKQISRELSLIRDIKFVILYGSYARGDFGAKSDLDLFIMTSKLDTIEDVHNAIIKIEEKIGKSIQPTVRTEEEFRKTDSGLLQNLLREGKILFLRDFYEISAVTLLKQRPYIIYSIGSFIRERKRNMNTKDFYIKWAGKNSLPDVS
jgi:predicted nucleotidyltransferase